MTPIKQYSENTSDTAPNAIITVCVGCKKQLGKDNRWFVSQTENQLEKPGAVSHGLCPQCAQKLYPEFYHSCKEKNGKQ